MGYLCIVVSVYIFRSHRHTGALRRANDTCCVRVVYMVTNTTCLLKTSSDNADDCSGNTRDCVSSFFAASPNKFESRLHYRLRRIIVSGATEWDCLFVGHCVHVLREILFKGTLCERLWSA